MKHLFLSIALYILTVPAFLASVQNKKTDATIFGDVQSNGEHIPFVGIFLDDTSIGTTTDATGHYLMTNLPVGEYPLLPS